MTTVTTHSYLLSKGWNPTHMRGNEADGYTATGHCPFPFHNDHRPSFKIWPDGCWKCFSLSCGRSGPDVIALINHMELGFDPSDRGWARAYELYDILCGRPPGTSAAHKEKQGPLYTKVLEKANEEEQAVLTIFMKWCHYHLWTRQGTRGRDYYERERGIPLETLKPLLQVGYVPRLSLWNQADRALYGELASAMLTHIGKDWRHVALSLGLLWEREGEPDRLSLSDRVMHFCVDIDQPTQALFYHGRQAHFPGEPDPRYKHMCPWNVAKVPFTVPVEEPTRVVGTFQVESPIGVLALAHHHLRSLGWIGGEPRALVIRRYPEPDIVMTDDDPRMVDGELVVPGDLYAEKFRIVCVETLHRRMMRVRPRGGKDPDTAIKHGGIEPLLHDVEQQGGHIHMWPALTVPYNEGVSVL